MHAYMHACMHACNACMYVSVSVCMYVCMHACMDACMHVCSNEMNNPTLLLFRAPGSCSSQRALCTILYMCYITCYSSAPGLGPGSLAVAARGAGEAPVLEALRPESEPVSKGVRVPFKGVYGDLWRVDVRQLWS